MFLLLRSKGDGEGNKCLSHPNLGRSPVPHRAPTTSLGTAGTPGTHTPKLPVVTWFLFGGTGRVDSRFVAPTHLKNLTLPPRRPFGTGASAPSRWASRKTFSRTFRSDKASASETTSGATPTSVSGAESCLPGPETAGSLRVEHPTPGRTPSDPTSPGSFPHGVPLVRSSGAGQESSPEPVLPPREILDTPARPGMSRLGVGRTVPAPRRAGSGSQDRGTTRVPPRPFPDPSTRKGCRTHWWNEGTDGRDTPRD